MTNIDLKGLVYYKDEVDDKINILDNDINLLDMTKVDKVTIGSPGGSATLDGTGKHAQIEIPYADSTEGQDPANDSTVMNPRRVNEALESKNYQTKDDADLAYGDLRSDGSILMHSNYNPQSGQDIATVEYVQTSTSGASHSFVVDTKADMLLLTGIKVGDTCFVTAEIDPIDNGKFVAKMDDPVLLDDWAERENKTAWGGIIGTLSDQTDLENRFATDEAAIALNTAKVTNEPTNLGITYSATEVGITSSDGTNIIIDPVDGIDAGVMTSADKGILDALAAPQTSLEATGHIPAVVLNVENGGVASTVETTYNNGTTTHAVSTIQWVAGENEADWTLSNKDTGVVETMFRILNGGKATLGTALVQSEVMTVDTQIDSRIFIDSTGNEPAPIAGQIYYADNTLNLNTSYGTTLNIGKELTDEVYNNTGATIGNGQPVIVTGLANGLPSIVLAQADTFARCDGVVVATMDIPHGTIGAITAYGKVNDLDLSGFNINDKLYVSETTPGVYTTTPPDRATFVGRVFSNDAVAGSLYVKPESHVVLPTITAYMNDGSLATTAITAAYQLVSGYTTSGNVAMEYDPSPTNGTITVPTAGIYSLSINLSFTFDGIGNSEETFNLRLVGTSLGNKDMPITVPRNGGAASAYPSMSFSATAGEVFHLELGGATDDLTTLVEHLMSFEITSKHIR